MLAFILQRLAQAVPVVLLSTVAVFLLLRLIPGDPAEIMAGTDATPEALAAIRHDMGLDQPLPVQYALWITHLARGDLGKSSISKMPVSLLLSQRIPATLQLAAAALLLTLSDRPTDGDPGSASTWQQY